MTTAALTGKRPAATTNQVTDDARYVAAAKRYSAIQDERDELKIKYDAARAVENSGQPKDDAVARYLAGESERDSQASAQIWADLAIREAALTRQREEMGRVAQQVSAEVCAREKARHDAIVGRLAKALDAVQAADRELVEFGAELTRRGVVATFPFLGFLPARVGTAFSVAEWRGRYQDYLK